MLLSLHWTLIVLLALCAVILAANALVWRITGQVRAVGIALTLGWAVQQVWWWRTGADSLLLFALSDAVIVAVLWRGGRHFTDAAITFLLVAGWCVHAAIAWVGLTAPFWWASWSIVAMQLVLGLPWPAFQPIHHTISHGPLRAGSKLP